MQERIIIFDKNLKELYLSLHTRDFIMAPDIRPALVEAVKDFLEEPLPEINRPDQLLFNPNFVVVFIDVSKRVPTNHFSETISFDEFLGGK